MTTQAILSTHPRPTALSVEALGAAIDAALECVQVCTACADACLAEEIVAELRRCIVLDLNCADICQTTARVLSRHEADRLLLVAQLEACIRACELCGNECASHAEMHEHCRDCSESCARCEAACNALRLSLSA